MKSRTRLPLRSLAVTGSSLAFVALMLPACGSDADIEFPNAPTSSSSGDGGRGGNTSSSSGQGGGQTGSSSSGQGGGQTGSSSSGQGGQGGGTGGFGGSGNPEDCLDGLDNDLDGVIDCADDDCTTGFTCTEEPPTGWTPVALEQGMGAPPAATPCASGAMPESLLTGPAGPAECSACTCGALAGATCNAPQLLCFPGSQSCNANNQEDWTGNFANGNCAKPGLGFSVTLSCRLGNAASVNQPGSCPPSTSDFQNKDSWAGWAQSCDVKTSAGGCATGKVCAAKPADTQSLCIRQDGQQMCPNGWKAVEAYAGGKDDRSCSACSCMTNATCTGANYQVLDFNNCDAGGDPPITIDTTMCRNVTAQIDSFSWSVLRNPPTAGGSCAAQGGEPQGSVQTQGPVTFCCK